MFTIIQRVGLLFTPRVYRNLVQRKFRVNVHVFTAVLTYTIVIIVIFFSFLAFMNRYGSNAELHFSLQLSKRILLFVF